MSYCVNLKNLFIYFHPFYYSNITLTYLIPWLFVSQLGHLWLLSICFCLFPLPHLLPFGECLTQSYPTISVSVLSFPSGLCPSPISLRSDPCSLHITFSAHLSILFLDALLHPLVGVKTPCILVFTPSNNIFISWKKDLS